MKLRTTLRPDLESGGDWTYLGYHPTNYNLVSIDNVPVSDIFTIDLSTDDPLVVVANASKGFYGFEYELTDTCANTATTNVYLQVIEDNRPKAQCDYWLNYSARDYNSQGEIDLIRISSFVVNGTELLKEPKYLGDFAIYMLDGIACQASAFNNYIRNFVDTLESLNVDGYSFIYSDRTESNPTHLCSGYKYHTIFYPEGDTFEIVFQQNKGSWINTEKWTETSVFSYISSAWQDQSVAGTNGHTRTGGNVIVCV